MTRPARKSRVLKGEVLQPESPWPKGSVAAGGGVSSDPGAAAGEWHGRPVALRS